MITDKVIWCIFVVLFVMAMLVLSQHSIVKSGMKWNNQAIGVLGKD